MTESKIGLHDRLRRSGQWPEAAAWKDAKVKELRAGGMGRAEAREEAWRLLAVEYPPAPSAAREPDPGPAGDGAAAKCTATGRVRPLPTAWGEIAESAPFEVEVEWVHQNRVLVVEDRPNKRPEFHWERAQRPAPSYGAVNLMEFAATNRKGFMDILQRMKPGMAGEEDIVRREKVRIEEIRRILEQFRKQADAELLANVPQVVQDRVRAVLTDWSREHALTLSGDATAALQAHVANLVQQGMEATEEAAEEKPTTPPMAPAE